MCNPNSIPITPGTNTGMGPSKQSQVERSKDVRGGKIGPMEGELQGVGPAPGTKSLLPQERVLAPVAKAGLPTSCTTSSQPPGQQSLPQPGLVLGELGIGDGGWCSPSTAVLSPPTRKTAAQRGSQRWLWCDALSSGVACSDRTAPVFEGPVRKRPCSGHTGSRAGGLEEVAKWK